MLNFFVKRANLTNHFSSFIPYKKEDPRQKKFVEDLALVIAKGYMHILVVENHCLQQMLLHQILCVVFPNQK
jgi:hypothetical protein